MIYRLAWMACLVLIVSCSSEQPAPTPTPDREGLTIEGVVREAGSGQPITLANVFVVEASGPGSLRTTSDSDGYFILSGLAPGRYVLAASREGYVAPDRLENSGFTFHLRPEAPIRNALLQLLPAGSIAGRILKPDGQPARKVEIQLLQNHYIMGKLQLSAVVPEGVRGRLETNENGEFRLVGVDPGTYFIRLNPREASVESILPGGKPPGPALYPGVSDLARAAAVEVVPGRETRLKDATLVSDQRGWIRVFLVDRSGESLEGFGDWTLEPPGWVGSRYPRYQQRIVNNAHEFQPDLPGTYEISAFWSTPKGPLVGRLRVVYQGATVERNMTLEKGKGSLSGTVMLQDSDGGLRPVPSTEVSIGPDIPYVARVDADGKFAISEVYAGRYKLGYVRGIPADGYVLSARQGNRDVLREDLTVENSASTLEIVIGARGGSLDGSVRDGEGKPIHNALVALVPESPLRERTDYYGAFVSGRSDQDGRYELRGITPGIYKAYAWSDAPASAFRNAEFMKAFAAEGVRVEVEPGGQRTVELRALASE